MTTHNTKLKRALFAGSFVLATLVAAGCGEVTERADFGKNVEGKSDQEVIKNVGKPDNIDQSNPERVTWTYNSRTFDVNNQNKRDAKTIVVLKPSGNGKLQVAEIAYVDAQK